jgi:hypothetical protein
LKKQLGNRETIFPLPRKETEAVRTYIDGKASQHGFRERQMIIETKKAFAVAALIVATGVAAVELTRSSAQAESIAPYASARIAGAFDVAANMPPVEPVRVPMAVKGDLPVPLGCMLGMSADEQAECMDVAYEVPSEPSIVVETRFGNTSTLLRMDSVTVADFGKIFQDDERNSQTE